MLFRSRARVVAVVADPDLKRAAGREIALNVDEGLGRHGVGLHSEGLLELDGRDGLGEGQRAGDAGLGLDLLTAQHHADQRAAAADGGRSEEHTSELSH